MAVAKLGVRIHGKMVFKTTHYVEKNVVADAKDSDSPGSGDSEDHPDECFRQAGFRAGEAVRDLAECDLGVGFLHTCSYW